MKPLNFELVQFAQKFGIPFEWDPFGLQSLQWVSTWNFEYTKLLITKAFINESSDSRRGSSIWNGHQSYSKFWSLSSTKLVGHSKWSKFGSLNWSVLWNFGVFRVVYSVKTTQTICWSGRDNVWRLNATRWLQYGVYTPSVGKPVGSSESFHLQVSPRTVHNKRTNLIKTKELSSHLTSHWEVPSKQDLHKSK